MQTLPDQPEDSWEWPEEQSLSAYYVRNRVVPGEKPAPAPEPKKIAPRGPTTDGAGNNGVQVREYSWSDDVEKIMVYVPIPGVVREKTSVEFHDMGFEVLSDTDGFGKFRLVMNKLFEPVVPGECSYKVLERKEKLIITLRKVDPPGYGKDAWVGHKKWHLLHYGALSTRRVHLRVVHADRLSAAALTATPNATPTVTTTVTTTVNDCYFDCYNNGCTDCYTDFLRAGGSSNISALSSWEQERMYRQSKLAAGPEMPKLPTGGPGGPTRKQD